MSCFITEVKFSVWHGLFFWNYTTSVVMEDELFMWKLYYILFIMAMHIHHPSFKELQAMYVGLCHFSLNKSWELGLATRKWFVHVCVLRFVLVKDFTWVSRT